VLNESVLSLLCHSLYLDECARCRVIVQFSFQFLPFLRLAQLAQKRKTFPQIGLKGLEKENMTPAQTLIQQEETRQSCRVAIT